jgi:hypothetical protein
MSLMPNFKKIDIDINLIISDEEFFIFKAFRSNTSANSYSHLFERQEFDLKILYLFISF